MHSHLQTLGFFFYIHHWQHFAFCYIIYLLCALATHPKQEKVVVKVKGTLEQRDHQGAFEQHTFRSLSVVGRTGVWHYLYRCVE